MLMRNLILACLTACGVSPAMGQIGNAFTYQGRLEVSGVPYTGAADVRFQVYHDATSTVLDTVTVTGIQVVNGLFKTNVDFGENHFTGGPRSLALMVRRPGEASYTALADRQQVLPAPYSLFAPNSTRATTAGSVDGITRLTSNDFIGIGTATPTARLHVRDAAHIIGLFESPSTIGSWLQLRNTSVGGRQWNLVSTGSANGEQAGKLLFNDQTAVATRMTIDTAGRVGIGTSFPSERLEVAGNVRCDVLVIDGGSDVSESYDIQATDGHQPVPGTVVSIDPERVGKLRVSSAPYDRTVAGVVSGANGVKPGLVLNHAGSVADGKHPVANVGRVWCYVDADAGGSVVPGDLLTTSTTPGHAMKAADPDRANGAILGKAMSPLKEGKGMVLVLVGLQ